jgi:hypothetical protein
LTPPADDEGESFISSSEDFFRPASPEADELDEDKELTVCLLLADWALVEEGRDD